MPHYKITKIKLSCFLERMVSLAKFLENQEKDPKISEIFKENIRSYCDYKIDKLYKEYKNSC